MVNTLIAALHKNCFVFWFPYFLKREMKTQLEMDARSVDMLSTVSLKENITEGK